MTLTESDVITAVNAFTNYSCQTSAENTGGTNTTANILYTSQSRTQSNFSLSYSLAQLQLAKDQTRYGVTLADASAKVAYAYLIAYYHERKFKDWHASSIKSGDDQVNKQGSGYLAAYYDIFEQLKSRDVLTSSDTDLLQHTDYLNYPDNFRVSQMDDEEIDLEE